MAKQFKMARLEDMVDLPVSNWREIGANAVESIRHWVRDKKHFGVVPYSAEYRKRKVAREAGPKGVSVASTSGVPDLTLTGRMLDALIVTAATDHSVTFGWAGEAAAKVEYNADNGRSISSDDAPLIPPVDKEVMADIDRLYGIHIDKSESYEKVTIRL